MTVPAARSTIPTEILDPAGLASRAVEVAARHRSPQTRRTYAAVYRSLVAFLGEHAVAADLTPEAVRAYAMRSRMPTARRRRSRNTCPRYAASRPPSAHADVRTVRSASVARGEPRALSHEEFARLLKMPDRRTRQGRRDLALLHLLGSAGLRRSEASALVLGDVDERRRAADPRLRHAIKSSTSWWVTVPYAKRGRSRVVPLDDDALEAIIAWVKSRPTTATEHLLLSLPRAGNPGPLDARDIARIVARHAQAADLPEERRSPHVLRHTFCTHLADTGADTAVIRELAGHADIRTTTVYTAVSSARPVDAVDERQRQRRGVSRAAR